MPGILRIYRTDWRRLFRAPVALLLIAALVVLPSVYDWVNVAAVWDPYTRTSGIPVAVANLDRGSAAAGTAFNVGEEVVASLRNNTSLGWRFVSRAAAESGVRRGDYYAAIVIPADFSARLAGVLEGGENKPELVYEVNEKLNAIAPKITDKGASSITARIDEHFTRTLSETVLAALQRADRELVSNLPMIRRVEAGLFALEKRLPELEEAGQKVLEVEAKWPEIAAAAQRVAGLTRLLPEADAAASAVLLLQERWPQIEEAAAGLAPLRDRLAPGLEQAGAIASQLEQGAADTAGRLEAALAGLEAARAALEAAAEPPAAAAEPAATAPPVEALAAAKQAADAGSAAVQALQGSLPELRQAAEARRLGELAKAELPQALSGLPAAGAKLDAAAGWVRGEWPAAEQRLREVSGRITAGLPETGRDVHRAASLVRGRLPELTQAVRRAADAVRRVKGAANLDEVSALLAGDMAARSDFLASPVLLKEKKLFPIPNYGSAMTPFYVVLSLWVGGTLLVSLLRISVETDEVRYRPYQLFFGRLLTFSTIGVLQALVAVLGNLYLLHCYVASPAVFVLSAVLISLVFVTVLFVLVSVFGNVGKGIAIIFMVLQFSSSGGTFPVSTAGPFFEALHPFMPFTYAIGLLREAVGGAEPGTVLRDAAGLLGFAALALLAALALKRPLERLVRHSAEQAARSRLIS
ncbi:YhgE/Pip domain-containing protein [Paenibacillus glufosinatiresistens]|uniref:YhgE/Pip domain-containing protein n=1 Tax=Paenibacillus glufosinatiresistens TaxID=3070657 RepID=UPI00286E3EFE|nr:YhgE/Pip domain-containing protein [Paenibacillus sp. YX.27]